ncbi:MAG: TIGR04282 family arsenosugar biosynthesis glycosyltransferase [Gammaproteobacteria bacterium]
MNYPTSRLLVFTRAPRTGQVKTRLIPQLGPQGAADFHARLIHHCLQIVTRAGLCPVELWCAPSCHDPFFQDCRERYGVELYDQAQGELGERMHKALGSALARAESAVLVGTDIPSIEAADLDTAFQSLQQGKDAVVGPARDGGYYLIGLKQPNRWLFEGISWGTSTVFQETLSRLQQLEMDWLSLREHADVDTPDDYQRLPEAIRLAAGSGNPGLRGQGGPALNGN